MHASLLTPTQRDNKGCVGVSRADLSKRHMRWADKTVKHTNSRQFYQSDNHSSHACFTIDRCEKRHERAGFEAKEGFTWMGYVIRWPVMSLTSSLQ